MTRDAARPLLAPGAVDLGAPSSPRRRGRVAVTIEVRAGRPVLVKRATDAPGRARLLHEARMLSLARHPGVAELLECTGDTDGHRGDDDGADEITLALAFVSSHTLATTPCRSPEHAAGLVAAVAETVADLHHLGVVHGRISADHIVVNPLGHPVLVGFRGAHAGAGVEPSADDTQTEVPQRADDVAALGRVLRTLLLEQPDPSRIVPERRWRAGRGDAASRRALLTLADHATADDPRSRPGARRFAAAILSAVPGATLVAPAPEPIVPTASGPAGVPAAGGIARVERAEHGEPGDVETAAAAPGRARHAPDAVDRADADAARRPPVTRAPDDHGTGARNSSTAGADGGESAAALRSRVDPDRGSDDARTDAGTGSTAGASGASGGGASPPRMLVRPAHTGRLRPRSATPHGARRTRRGLPLAGALLGVTMLGFGVVSLNHGPRPSLASTAATDSPPARGRAAADDPPPAGRNMDGRDDNTSGTTAALEAGPGTTRASAAPGAPGRSRGSVLPEGSVADGNAPANAGPRGTSQPVEHANADPTSKPETNPDPAGASAPGPIPAPRFQPAGVVENDGRRYAVGAPGDELAIGSLTCRATDDRVAVLRPSTGELFVFEGWAVGAEELVASVTAHVAPGSHWVLPPGSDCAPLAVREPDGRTSPVTIPSERQP